MNLTDGISQYINENKVTVRGDHDHFVVGPFEFYMFDTFYKGEKITSLVTPQELYFIALAAFGKGLFIQEEVSLPKHRLFNLTSPPMVVQSPPLKFSQISLDLAS